MIKKDWFDLILIATIALSVGILLGAMRYSDKIEKLENQVAEDGITSLDTYDYYLLIVMSRQNLNQGSYSYVLHEAGKPLTTDNFTHETDQLWSVGEFVLAIEIDEVGNVYFTDLDATTDIIVSQYQEQIVDDFELVIELQQYYYQNNITSHSFGDWLQINYPELYRRVESYF